MGKTHILKEKSLELREGEEEGNEIDLSCGLYFGKFKTPIKHVIHHFLPRISMIHISDTNKHDTHIHVI